MGTKVLVLLGALAAVSALPPRPDTAESAAVRAFEPDRQIIYHLFTRSNPTTSQPLLYGNEGLLTLTNYEATRRTVILLHGWHDDISAPVNSVLVPALLAAGDVNVIAVDWFAGSDTINVFTLWQNAIAAGKSVAKFVNWLNGATGASGNSYHIVGHDFGAHMAGIVGRNMDVRPSYITALSPTNLALLNHDEMLQFSDSEYTEVIHTSAGLASMGYVGTLGDTDFYPNGGRDMPGCASEECNHLRSIYYFSESLTLGGYRGKKCGTYIAAMTGNCLLLGRLNMGGLNPKTGSTGIYYLVTNAAPPFSQT